MAPPPQVAVHPATVPHIPGQAVPSASTRLCASVSPRPPDRTALGGLRLLVLRWSPAALLLSWAPRPVSQPHRGPWKSVFHDATPWCQVGWGPLVSWTQALYWVRCGRSARVGELSAPALTRHLSIVTQSGRRSVCGCPGLRSLPPVADTTPGEGRDAALHTQAARGRGDGPHSALPPRGMQALPLRRAHSPCPAAACFLDSMDLPWTASQVPARPHRAPPLSPPRAPRAQRPPRALTAAPTPGTRRS